MGKSIDYVFSRFFFILLFITYDKFWDLLYIKSNSYTFPHEINENKTYDEGVKLYLLAFSRYPEETKKNSIVRYQSIK